jgi:hypothetical protein
MIILIMEIFVGKCRKKLQMSISSDPPHIKESHEKDHLKYQIYKYQ